MIHNHLPVEPMPKSNWAPIVELDIDGTDTAVRIALKGLREKLNKARLSQDDYEHTQIVLGEVLNNIVEHAFNGVSDGKIRLAAFRSRSTLRLVVKDNGIPMPNGQLPMRAEPRIDVAIPDLPEGGFGWPMTRALTSDISYQRQAHDNILSLQIPVSLAASRPADTTKSSSQN